MKKVFLSMLVLVFMLSLVLIANVHSVSADYADWSIVKSGSLSVEQQGGSTVYIIHYTYTVTNKGATDIVIDSITDDKIGPIALPLDEAGRTIPGSFGEPYSSLTFTGTYDATMDVQNGVVSVCNTATAEGHSGTNKLTPADSNEVCIPLPPIPPVPELSSSLLLGLGVLGLTGFVVIKRKELKLS